MKKILLAWIEQVLQFDSQTEYEAYKKDLNMKFSIQWERTDAAGNVIVDIRKQYNKNLFPEGGDLNEA